MNTAERPRVAIVGAGPAGTYAADLLLRDDPLVEVDLYERFPAPFGLVRYGVAPDHPRIKRITSTLHAVMDNPRIRLRGNVEVGRDVHVADLLHAYAAVVIATGADKDLDLGIPGEGLADSHGASSFVAWYDGHPDTEVDWDLSARATAVIGAGNVALDVARVLARPIDDMRTTDIPRHVEEALEASCVRDVHLFARRGPADARFSPNELRELGEVTDVDLVVDPRDLVLDDHGERMIRQFAQRRIIVETLREWADRAPAIPTAARRVHLHFHQRPVRLVGTTSVQAIDVERTRPTELGRVEGTGEITRYPVQAVYRAIGYRSTPVPGVPFDQERHTIPHVRGRVSDHAGGGTVPRLYTTGWIKRGPIGLIGSTKSDAAETVSALLSDCRDSAGAWMDPRSGMDHIPGATIADWEGWLRLDAAEQAGGARRGRERTKVADWTGMLSLTT
ncbi:FAD-dependent oxidoreductase [Demequina silvatica]|uniref:FAD-dependent oxidoreductase n=1 Tax=Demequina silvatica TaxID=1638988 RepID=UPI001E618B07|nr:FAD-dependent oxidoreductase [Demequina silvatica]